ncbi:1,5-anhydro-D-fructose reductase-like [Condylostylus longicornis]|uniref:1,5-anhydro-D-fructose reductase-like n=1 Tax=Condylostylus longicornis TaxID=2530218 RepID=UPI00244DF968|nr:1,5-anhydro-D-fructose reductase-like [Condylostylus longicornis]
MLSLQCQSISNWILKFPKYHKTIIAKNKFWTFGSNPIHTFERISTKEILNIPKSVTSIQCKFLSKMSSSGAQKSEYLKAPKIKLNNGLEMPVFGLGTYKSLENEGEEAVKYAIDLGYRHIDTAFFYENEGEVGKAVQQKIAENVIKREDIFIVTKLWCTFHEPQRVEYACKKSLENLGLDYIDLYLMHLPVGYVYIDDKTLLPKDDNNKLMLNDVDYLDTWKAMEDLVRKGYVKSIGISNFNSEQIERLLKNCEIKPVTNQVECCPTLNQKKLIKFCLERDITLTAYCPLGRPRPDEKKPDFLYSEDTLNIAKKYNKTPAQIILRYLIDIGTIPIPKSSNKGRILENFDIFDFKLNDDDIKIIDKFNTGERLVPFDLIKGQNHKYFPFNIEF